MTTRRLRKLRSVALVLALVLLATLALGQDETATPEATAEATPERTEAPSPTPETPREIGLYERLTLRADINPDTYTNPFNPGDIELIGIFNAPSGDQIVILGFWMQPYADNCPSPCLQENLQPSGAAEWQVRFTPTETGTWDYLLQVRDDGEVISSREAEFTVVLSDRPGFIRAAPNRRYFQYDDGQPYFIIGHNLNWSWSGGGGIHAYERWLRSLSRAGGNYARVYIDVPWFIGLEWDTVGDYSAAQDDAARLDRLLDLAEENGVAVQLVILWNQALRTYSGAPVLLPETPARPDTSADWDDNPYNSARGGLLSGPTLFFSDGDAEELFRRRLRYIVARWGYSPQIFAWEMIDEIDAINTTNPDVKHDWLEDMAGYLRQIDQQQHLITAGSREYNQSLAENPQLDFTQVRFFQSLPIQVTAEQETSVVDRIRQFLQVGDHPTLVTGFSLNPWFEPTQNDAEGVHVQNTLWAAALAGAGGGAAAAWGETYIIPQRLERYYVPLAAFASGVDWANLDLQPAEAALIIDGADVYQPVRVEGFTRQLRVNLGAPAPRVIAADGIYPDLSSVSGYLYGQVYNTEYRQTQTYRVTAPVDTYLSVGVRGSSDLAGSTLAVTLDGELAAQMILSPSTRPAALRVPLPAGEHTVVLENVGEDWLELEYIEVGALAAPARVLTLRDAEAGVALAWLQHRDYTWDQVAAGITPAPLSITYRLDEMPPGRYRAELWDPLAGGVLGEEIVRVGEDGVLRFDLLPLTRQLALRFFRQPDAPTATPTNTPEPTATPEATVEVTLEATLETAKPTPTPERTIEVTVIFPFVTATEFATPEPSATRPPLAATNTPRPTPDEPTS